MIDRRTDDTLAERADGAQEDRAVQGRSEPRRLSSVGATAGAGPPPPLFSPPPLGRTRTEGVATPRGECLPLFIPGKKKNETKNQAVSSGHGGGGGCSPVSSGPPGENRRGETSGGARESTSPDRGPPTARRALAGQPQSAESSRVRPERPAVRELGSRRTLIVFPQSTITQTKNNTTTTNYVNGIYIYILKKYIYKLGNLRERK